MALAAILEHYVASHCAVSSYYQGNTQVCYKATDNNQWCICANQNNICDAQTTRKFCKQGGDFVLARGSREFGGISITNGQLPINNDEQLFRNEWPPTNYRCICPSTASICPLSLALTQCGSAAKEYADSPEGHVFYRRSQGEEPVICNNPNPIGSAGTGGTTVTYTDLIHGYSADKHNLLQDTGLFTPLVNHMSALYEKIAANQFPWVQAMSLELLRIIKDPLLNQAEHNNELTRLALCVPGDDITPPEGRNRDKQRFLDDVCEMKSNFFII